jgi:hypothetical protein
MEEEFFNFLELLVLSLKVLWATFEHVEMEHEFDLIGVQVKKKVWSSKNRSETWT